MKYFFLLIFLITGCAVSPPLATQVKSNAVEKTINSQEFIDAKQSEVDNQ